jgi:uncharacterized phage protein (TIGR02218 family)/uncharacterized protein (TIGR02217 family)
MVDINQVFPVVESSGIQINLVFSNTVLVNSSGVEQRIVRWQDPIRSYNFSRKLLKSTEITNIANFYDLTKGSNFSFLYRDRSDNTDNGKGVLYPHPDGTRKNFQLVKKYQAGNNIHYRPITQIEVMGSIKSGNTTLTSWTLLNNGQVQFTTAPDSSSNLLSATFDFYVPVTFDSDEFTYKMVGLNIYEIDKLLLKEIKQQLFLYPVDVLADTPSTGTNVINFPTNLDYLAQNEDYSHYDTEIIVLSSGFRKRTTRLEIPFFKQIFGQRKTFNQSQIETILNFWLANKANGAQFYYFDNVLTKQNVLARFDTQELTYTIASTNFVYQLNPLAIKLYRGSVHPTADTPMQTPTNILAYPLMRLARICNITVPTTSGNLVFGFTTADRDITIDGQIYTASTAFEPSALEQNISWTVNNQEIKTVINSSQITEAELASGLFDKATIIVAVIDYLNPPSTLSDAVIEQTGVVGEITTSDTQYIMENLSKACMLLKQPVSYKMSPFCPYNFGDSDCGKDKTQYTYTGTITNAGDITKRYFSIDNTGIPDHQCVAGSILFTSGANINLEFMVFDNYHDAATNTTTVTLNVPAFFIPSVGDTVTLQGGCDKQFATCAQLYNNATRFGGFPTGRNFMPNNSFYLSSPIQQS